MAARARPHRHHPGAGHLDFSAILGALADTGYTGWVSGEFLPLPDAETAADAGTGAADTGEGLQPVAATE